MTVEFGQRILAYMEREELSQRKLARKIHIRRSTISRVLKGDSDLFTKDAIKFAEGLNVSPNEKIEFNLSSQGFSDQQIEQKIQGKPMRDLENIRHAKKKLFDSKGRQFGVYRY